jgi:hypothetical protein
MNLTLSESVLVQIVRRVQIFNCINIIQLYLFPASLIDQCVGSNVITIRPSQNVVC